MPPSLFLGRSGGLELVAQLTAPVNPLRAQRGVVAATSSRQECYGVVQRPM